MNQLIKRVAEARIRVGHRDCPENRKELQDALASLNRVRVQRGIAPMTSQRGVHVVSYSVERNHRRS